jgi:aspartate carbamoyltransferase catalytic subunit
MTESTARPLKHILGIEHFTRAELYDFLDNAKSFAEISTRDIKKVPALRGKTVINLFLEASTRTRTSFEIAGKRLSADVINISGPTSSVVKGETLLDTARSLQAMSPDILVVRHKESGAAHLLARHLNGTAVINGGDGMHEHPTQALLDCFTLYRHFAGRKDGIEKLKIAIVGDVRHSRVARSNIWAHLLLGNEVTLVGPATLVPPEFTSARCFGSRIRICTSLAEGVAGADVVIVLRMQLERQEEHFVPTLQEYTNEYCVTEKLLKRVAPDCVVMHPGPMNRGTEISSEVADGPRSLVERQVEAGVTVRMAALFWVATGQGQHESGVEERR